MELDLDLRDQAGTITSLHARGPDKGAIVAMLHGLADWLANHEPTKERDVLLTPRLRPPRGEQSPA